MCERVLVSDLDEACMVLDEARVEYDLDSGDRLFSHNIDEIIDVLEENDIDYDLI